LRYDLPRVLAQLTQAQLYGFVDYGDLFTREASPGTAANVQAASAGGGLRVGALDKLNADLQAAKGVEGPRDDWRFFFTVAAHY
jgi:hemolysin activation/secretion protein